MRSGLLAWVNVHAPMLELPDGTLLSPHCGSIGTTDTRQHPQAVVRSTDGGRTWGDGAVIALDPSGARVYHQGSLGRFSDGEIVAVMHSEDRGKTDDGKDVMLVGLWLSRSKDDGRTWSALEQLPLEFSGATHHVLVLRDDRLLCVWGNRYDPSIRASVSGDRGRTWETTRGWALREGEHLDTSGTKTRLRGQTTDGVIRSVPFTDIGEPCSTQLPDGRIVTVYYWLNGAADPMRYIEAAIYDVG